MTDEERKAIELLKEYLTNIKSNDNRINSQYNDNYGYVTLQFTKWGNNDLQTLLNLIDKQEKAIDRMSKYIEEITGSCPYDTFDYQVRDCDNECKDQMAECWKEYFMEDKE